MRHPAWNPDPAIGRHDPDLVVRGTGDRPMQREDQLALAMHVHRHFRRMIREVELARDCRAIGEIGVEDGNG